MTITFKTFLGEAEVKKMSHLQHLEDYIFSDGAEGIGIAIKFVEEVANSLQGNKQSEHIIIQGKWDGSPSTIFGFNPENNKFFVATKAAFSKDPKLCYDAESIRKYYGSEPDLANTLSIALKYLPSIVKKGIYQGDLLFTDRIKKDENIDGVPYITFQPNTIKYGAEKGSKNYDAIDKANFGIVIHAQYTGKSMADISVNFDVNKANLKHSSTVWYDISTHENIHDKEVKLDAPQNKIIEDTIKRIKGIYTTVDPEFLNQISKGGKSSLLQQFNNKMIRDDKQFTEPDMSAEFAGHIENKHQEDTAKGKSPSESSKEKMVTYFMDNKDEMSKIYRMFNLFKEVKKLLITKLEELSPLSTFQNGKKSAGEGFVIVDTKTNHVTKLVDRREFSRNNFQRRMESYETFYNALVEGLDLSKYETTPAKKKVNVFAGKLQPPHKIHLKRIKDGNVTEVFLAKGNYFPFEIQKEIIQTVLGKGVTVTQTPSGIFVPAIVSELRKSGKELDTFFCGEDRINSYQKQAAYFPELNSKGKVELLGQRSDGADGDEEVSGTAIRNAIKNDDFETFKKMMDPKVATLAWFKKLQKAMEK